MTTSRDTDIAIVGGGVAGLIAAAAAARAGSRVTLFERGPLGGRGRSAVTEAGFCLNQGPHALYVDQALHAALGGFGIEARGSAPLLDGAQGLVGGQLGLLPGGPGSLLRTGLISHRSKPQLAKLLATIGRKKPADHARQTVDEWLDSEKLRPDVRQLVASIIRLTSYCNDQDIASADMAITQLQPGLTTGVLYLDGGWQQIVDSLSATADRLGVETRSGCAVRQIDGTTIRLEDHTVVQAGAVVVAGLSPEALSVLVSGAPDLRSAAGPAIEAATLDVGVRGEPEVGVVLGIDEPLYCSRHDPPAALAPEGHSLYGVMRYLRRDEDHDHRSTSAELESLMRRTGATADAIVESRYSHRLTVTQGQPLAANGGLAGRPAVGALGLPGVFLAGDWIGETGVLADASAASALAAADAAVAHAATDSVPA